MTKLKKLILSLSVLVMTSCSIGYENDGSAVYYNFWNEGSGQHKNKLNANPKTFEILKFDDYAKDDNYVFYEGSVIKGADAKTFVAIDKFYAKDKNRGYYAEKPVINSSGTGFKVINSYYSTDGKDVFFTTDPLNVSDVKRFRFVYNEGEEDFERWTTDGKFYYCENYKVPSNDYAHLTTYKKSGGISKDRHWVYFRDHKLNYDIDGKKVVDTIDAASFRVSGYLECRDKFGCFNVFHGRITCRK